MKRTQARLRGMLPALTTPFAGGRVDGPALCGNIACYESTGLSGYLVAGSTGEAVLLERRERRSAIEAARAAVPSDKLLVAGVCAESTDGAIEECRAAAGAGADAALVSTPHYYRSEMTVPVLERHLRAVADASPAPVLLYNVPKFTGSVLPLEVIERLAEHENVIGLKDSSGDLAYLEEVVRRTRDRLGVVCGSLAIVDEALLAGATGAILAAAVALPEPLVRLAAAAQRGVPAEARAIRQAIAATARLLADLGIPGFKAAVDARGLRGGDPRGPLLPLATEARVAVEGALDALVRDRVLPRLLLRAPS